MKRFLTLFLFVILVQIQFAENVYCAPKEGQAVIDSLRRELPNALQDTNRVNILNALCFYYYEINPTLGLNYGYQALELAESLQWKHGVGHVYGNLACNYLTLSDYPKALQLWTSSLQIHEQLGDKISIATTMLNMANVYESQGDYSKALELNFNVLKMFQEVKGNEKGKAIILGNIGYIYYQLRDNAKALDYFRQAIELYKHDDKQSGIASMLGYIGEVYSAQSEYEKAIAHLLHARKMNSDLGILLVEATNIKSLGVVYLSMAKNMQKNDALSSEEKRKAALEQAKKYTDTAITKFKDVGELNSLFLCYLQLSEIQELCGDHSSSLESYKKYSTLKDSVFNNEKSKGISQTQMRYERDKLDMQHQSELHEQKLIRNVLIAGFSVVLLFAGVFLIQRNKIKKGKNQSDTLLLNILPSEVADELKSTGTAQAKHFDNVTVLFTDFKNFTTVSEQLSPQELVDELHACFKGFDEICTKYSIEKIKTIGDAYLAVSGLPLADENHAENVVIAALEIREFMKKRRENWGLKTFEIRIGINSGSVVAGIVGVKKFAYDIWGDTVNTAARMEQNSEAGKINVSETTYALVKEKFSCEYRGEIDAKNKGKLKMYFVEKRQ
jgi:class 3 adenylate cyclase/tetratricopeptide (TPR) repeat protein